MFEVSTPINWLDAQSSCAIWGGDLTSITTERENNYLYTIIPDTVSKCWIGLNDREVEGTYTWTDGITSGYTNFTSTPSNDEINGCVEIDKTGEGSWVSVDCDTNEEYIFVQERFYCNIRFVLFTLLCLNVCLKELPWKWNFPREFP